MDDIKLQQRRQKKLHRLRPLSILSSKFEDHYTLSGHQLVSGAFSRVEECFKRRQKGPAADLIYAVKIIEKVQGFYSRPQILGEIDTYHLCQGHPHIIQLLQYFEDTHHFHLIFEKFWTSYRLVNTSFPNTKPVSLSKIWPSKFLDKQKNNMSFS